MKKCRKLNLIITFICLAAIVAVTFGTQNKAEAASASFTVNVSSKEISMGETVKVQVTYTADVETAYLKFNLYYPKELLTFNPGEDQNEADGIISENPDFSRNEDTKKLTWTYSFTSKSVGSATFTVKDIENYKLDPDDDGDALPTTGGTSSTVSILEKSKSGNCYLSDITPSVGTMTPSFSKNTTTYNIDVPSDQKICYIDFTKEDSSAKATLSGDEFVSEGKTTRKITVTAENGTQKVYTINLYKEAASEATAEPTKAPVKTAAPTETPKATAENTTEPGSDASAEATAEATEEAEKAGEPIGVFKLDGKEYTVYSIYEHLSSLYPDKNIKKAQNFLVNGNICKGIKAFDTDGKNAQFIIYAADSENEKNIYIYDNAEDRIIKFLGGERIFAAFDIIGEDDLSGEETASPTDDNATPMYTTLPDDIIEKDSNKTVNYVGYTLIALAGIVVLACIIASLVILTRRTKRKHYGDGID